MTLQQLGEIQGVTTLSKQNERDMRFVFSRRCEKIVHNLGPYK
jgi:hypothetical protein